MTIRKKQLLFVVGLLTALLCCAVAFTFLFVDPLDEPSEIMKSVKDSVSQKLESKEIVSLLPGFVSLTDDSMRGFLSRKYVWAGLVLVAIMAVTAVVAVIFIYEPFMVISPQETEPEPEQDQLTPYEDENSWSGWYYPILCVIFAVVVVLILLVRSGKISPFKARDTHSHHREQEVDYSIGIVVLLPGGLPFTIYEPSERFNTTPTIQHANQALLSTPLLTGLTFYITSPCYFDNHSRLLFRAQLCEQPINAFDIKRLARFQEMLLDPESFPKKMVSEDFMKASVYYYRAACRIQLEEKVDGDADQEEIVVGEPPVGTQNTHIVRLKNVTMTNQTRPFTLMEVYQAALGLAFADTVFHVALEDDGYVVRGYSNGDERIGQHLHDYIELERQSRTL